MTRSERRFAQELRAMTKSEVVVKALAGRITWLQAADILGISPRQVRRLKKRYELGGCDALRDRRADRLVRTRIAPTTIAELCRLRRDRYEDFSIKHFHEVVTEQHGIALSYTWTRLVLQRAGLAEKAPGRGQYRRKRERRPMVGMLLHLDASTHAWIPDVPKQDLVVALDDADGRILYARFVEQEGTMSTFDALLHVLQRFGRFCELYTDRGSHFCYTRDAGQAPVDGAGQLHRVLHVLGIRHIRARSPQARGRSERAFGTIQGRLPQELRVAGVATYAAANEYLESRFVPSFNRRFTVKPREKESAFTPIPALDLDMLLSSQTERTVRNDGTITLDGTTLQLPPSRDRLTYARCSVTVHHFVNGMLGISYQGRLLARYTADGEELKQRSAA
jgi:transposase